MCFVLLRPHCGHADAAFGVGIRAFDHVCNDQQVISRPVPEIAIMMSLADLLWTRIPTGGFSARIEVAT